MPLDDTSILQQESTHFPGKTRSWERNTAWPILNCLFYEWARPIPAR